MCRSGRPAEIASDRVLAHFDENETLVLATDASPVGLGIVLSHRYKDGTERPISFASRSLTASEKKYSQIDKEALAIYWGLKKFYQVVIPEKLQGKVLNELHLGHLGVVKNLARSFCYWKHIDRNIEDLAKSCRPCCLKQNLPEKVDVHPWLVPSGPWQRIHINFAGPIYGQYLFVIVDAYSKWVEVIPTKTTTSNWRIQQLRKLFSTFGYPFTLVSDNGPNFTSSIFNQFLQACGVTHKFSAPYHPATNGQAERFVQTVKKQLIAMENDGGDLHFKINHMLMSLRNATNATGSSAYELMFGRRIRTRLDLMKRPQDHTEMPDGCTKIKREFRVGDRVQVRNFGKDGKWKFGNIRRREGLVHYQIEMDNGQVWRRHINHIRPCKFEGED
ncbi:uncharacterized protein K02A2.6-like [Macrosteles quadrilineatus]|uniref:uncharacterized protein K02A2.6-like n=1 Tax=Macrosteles quadrilineatus TaxID=74068 RepID=UPI0023E31FE6|nr:uncharacterized protein K02A2.6-like [Macrosteles quadrilineatus]